MAFNFYLESTEIYRAVRREKVFLLKFTKILKNIFLFLFIISVLITGLSFFDFGSTQTSVKASVLFLAFYLIFYNLDLFSEFKIKKPNISQKISDAYIDIDDYNLAQFLDFDTAKIVLDAIKFCNKKKIPVNSTALLYSAIKFGKEINLICFRLGLNPKEVQNQVKNYLEKNQKQNDIENEYFSNDFEEVIKNATKISVDRKHEVIGEKEILVALANNDEFLKKILVDYDLKAEDVENLTSWLDSAEDLMKESTKFWTYENLLRQGSLGKNFSSGYTITLDKFSTDWKKIVSNWRFREIIGHKKEIEQLEIILAKSSLANALIVGNPGTGRKSIIEALAHRCYLGTSLPELNNKRV
ncbi:MAG: hypothetical protein WCK10_00630, partial [Candidatus Staskawiczbacteria bacterium]